MTSEKVPVIVCRVDRREDRFFGKYKDPVDEKWKRIPGGAYPPEINTREKALACARRWYRAEMAERQLAKAAPTEAPSWPDICQSFVEDVQKQVRGADGTKHEQITRGGFLARDPTLSLRPISEHDEVALLWLRTMLSQPKRMGADDEPRDPITVRNVARVLGSVYRFARRKGWFPKDRILPTQGDEFKAELAGALKEKKKLGKESRVACPTDTVMAIVHCEKIPEQRRLMRRTAFFTGLAPGELHGLRVADYRNVAGVKVLDASLQWTLERKGFPSRLAPLKTVWRKRKIPVHPSLEPWLDEWIATGWERHVGRTPVPNDFLFTDAAGKPFREESCETFLADIRLVERDTTCRGVVLDIYSLRHSFATILRRAGVPSDARDRLLGHRPKDTKALHYEDEDLPLLAAEVAKVPWLLDDDSAANGGAQGGGSLAENPSTLVTTLVAEQDSVSVPSSVSSMISAEEVRFELTEPLPVRRFSKPLP